MLKWFKSYFHKRYQFVGVGSATSENFMVPSSVGQGSILGPSLFLIFFDDSDNDCGSSSIFNFADDKKIAHKMNNSTDAAKLQTSIDKFADWCKTNDLQLNESKCNIITFTHKRNSLIF